MTNRDFSVNLKHYRNIAKLSIAQLAKKANVSEQAILSYENGTEMPDVATLSKLADALHVSTDRLLGRQTQKSASTHKKAYADENLSRLLRYYTNLRIRCIMGIVPMSILSLTFFILGVTGTPTLLYFLLLTVPGFIYSIVMIFWYKKKENEAIDNSLRSKGLLPEDYDTSKTVEKRTIKPPAYFEHMKKKHQ